MGSSTRRPGASATTQPDRLAVANGPRANRRGEIAPLMDDHLPTYGTRRRPFHQLPPNILANRSASRRLVPRGLALAGRQPNGRSHLPPPRSGIPHRFDHRVKARHPEASDAGTTEAPNADTHIGVDQTDEMIGADQPHVVHGALYAPISAGDSLGVDILLELGVTPAPAIGGRHGARSRNTAASSPAHGARWGGPGGRVARAFLAD